MCVKGQVKPMQCPYCGRDIPDDARWCPYCGAEQAPPEELQDEKILKYLDVMVDGEFMVDKKDVSLKWKGSSNQRVIDVQKSLAEGRVVLHAEG